MRITFSVLLLFFLTLHISAQEKSAIYFHIDKHTLKEKITSTTSVKAIKSNLILELKLKGYVGINIKDSANLKDQWHYYLNYETYFKSVILKTDKSLTKANWSSTYNAINTVLTNLENEGFPFAKLEITKQEELKKQLILHCVIDSGAYYTLGKINLKSEDNFNRKTLLNILNINEGETYNESKIKNLSIALTNNDLYTPLRPAELLFKENTADVYIYFKKKKSSNADGFIGFQQNATSQKIELNGNINLAMKNGLNRAESLAFNWKSNPDKSQNLLINFKYPYILNLPLGISSNFNIQKQDTTFLRNSYLGGIHYISSFYTVGVFTQFDNSFLLVENPVDNFRAFKKNTFGLEAEIQYNNLNKYKPSLNFRVGLFNYESDSLVSRSSSSNFSYEFELNQIYQVFKPIYLNSSLNLKQVNSNYLLSKNELFYFGGLKSVRGFYELELNGNTVMYVLNSLEFKPIDLLSLELIYDYAQFHSTKFFQTHSFGFGFNLKNDNNLLSIIVANGVIKNNPIDLKNTKLHIGFVSNF